MRAVGGMLILPAAARPMQQMRVPPNFREPGPSSQQLQATNGPSGVAVLTVRRRASMSGADLRVTARDEEMPHNKRARSGEEERLADESQRRSEWPARCQRGQCNPANINENVKHTVIPVSSEI